MYLFSILNKFSSFTKEIHEFSIFEIDYIWGRVNNEFQYLIDIKTRDIIKSDKFFLQCCTEIKEPIRKFLSIIQNLIKVKVFISESNEIAWFEFHATSKDFVQNSRISFETERNLYELIYFCYNYISINHTPIPNISQNEENLIKSLRNIPEITKIKLETNCKLQNTFYNFELGSYVKEQNFETLEKKGGFVFYDELSNYKQIIILSCLNKKTCIIINDKLEIEQWVNEANILKIKFLILQNNNDFINCSLQNCKDIEIYFLYLYEELIEDLEFIESEISESIETCFNKNVFITNKFEDFDQITIPLELLKRFINSLSIKFPQTRIPFQWIEFDQIFVLDECKEIMKALKLQSKWVWILNESEIENIYTFNVDLFDLYSEYFINSSDIKLKKHFHGICNENSVVIPISKLIKLKLIPLNLYLSLFSHEEKFFDYIDKLYEISRQDKNVLQIKNGKIMKLKDVLLKNPDGFPFKLYDIMQRLNSMSKLAAIENIENQSYFTTQSGKSLYSIFLEWKYDMKFHQSQNYKQLIDDQKCLICFDNMSSVYTICGHGFCKECKEMLLKSTAEFLCACPICRENLSHLDWIEIGNNSNEELKSSKVVKFVQELKKSKEKRILCIVPDQSQYLFFNECQSEDVFVTLANSTFQFEVLQNEYEWKLIISEKYLHLNHKIKLDFQQVYYISPEYKYFKNIYKLLLLNSKYFNNTIKLFFVLSNHQQEIKQIEKLIKKI